MIKISYPQQNLDAILKNEIDRLSIRGINGEFNLIYTQNKADVFHLKNHFYPYVKESKSNNKIKKRFFVYDDPETEHGPLSKEQELKVIESLLSKEFSKKLLPLGLEVFQHEI